MLKFKIFILMILVATLTLTACGDSTHMAAITGVIAHTHRMVLPEGYSMTILLEDTTKPDAPAKQITMQVIKTNGEVLPIPFAIEYDPNKIKPDHVYTVRVTIADPTGKTLYTNTSSVPVITNGQPTKNIDVTVLLVDQ